MPGKGWDDWTATERAVFISHLNQRDEALDRAIGGNPARWTPEPTVTSREMFEALLANARRHQAWIHEAEAWLEEHAERRAIRESQPDRFYRWER